VFTQLNASVAKIWGSEHRVRGSIRLAVTERIRGIGMVILVGLMLIAMLSATTAVTNFQRFLVRSTELSELGLEILNLGANLLLVAAFFAFLYRALPGTDARWREVWPGALVAAPLFAAANYGLGVYLGRNALGSAYGAAGSLVVLLLWVYFIAMVLFFGAEVSSAYAQKRRAREGKPPPGPGEPP
jgi:membrane protein